VGRELFAGIYKIQSFSSGVKLYHMHVYYFKAVSVFVSFQIARTSIRMLGNEPSLQSDEALIKSQSIQFVFAALEISPVRSKQFFF